jgi:hypothetical protein
MKFELKTDHGNIIINDSKLFAISNEHGCIGLYAGKPFVDNINIVEISMPLAELLFTEKSTITIEKSTITIEWSIEDVDSLRPDLTDKQKYEVLQAVKRHHDPNYGVTWQTLQEESDSMFPKPDNFDELYPDAESVGNWEYYPA